MSKVTAKQRTLQERTVEHASKLKNEKESTLYKHLSDDSGLQHQFYITSFHTVLFTLSFSHDNDKIRLKINLH